MRICKAILLALALCLQTSSTSALTAPQSRSHILAPGTRPSLYQQGREGYLHSDKPHEQVIRHRQSVASQDRLSHANEEVPGIELAARQALFNYGMQQGLEILQAKIQQLSIPAATKTFNLPIVGEFSLQLSDLRVAQFNASSDEGRLTIMDGKFDLWVTQVEVQLTFHWHWEKLGMQGTGTGELNLRGGNIDYRFHVTTSAASKPHIEVEEVSSKFDAVELQIKSFSADWLYQAVMSLFNDQIQKAVQAGIADALQSDVPDQLNKVLDTLPTKLDVKGLPFSTSFEYSIFTLTYVLVKGYGEVETESPAPARIAIADSAAMRSAVARKGLREPVVAITSSTQLPTHGNQQADQAITRCPFAATPMPLDSETIAADGHMTSIYLHESVINCMLWGLYRSNALQYTLQDGTIPKLHLTTDLLAMLIPQLPKQYPHQFLRIEVAALSMPHISFTAADGTLIQASYRTSIFVANETAGNPKIATLSANLTVKAKVNFDSTIITAAQVRHTVEDSSMPVSATQWDNTVAWFIQNYAGLFPLRTLIHTFVQLPVTSMVGLVNAASATYDGWFTVSGDVQLHLNGPAGPR